jgi:hypothetical protein
MPPDHRRVHLEQHAVKAAGLADQVAFLEVTVDPDRDSPARLAAYAQQFGATWPLLTGTSRSSRPFPRDSVPVDWDTSSTVPTLTPWGSGHQTSL